MQTLIRAIVAATILVCLGGPFMGCSLIGYWVGGAIDGPGIVLDSVSAVREKESTDAGPQPCSRFDAEPLASLLAKVSSEDDDFLLHAVPSPNAGFTDSLDQVQVEVITGYTDGRFHGNSLILDTALVFEPTSEGPGRYRFFPDEPVGVTFRDSSLTRLNGTVLRVSERNIALRVGERDLGFSLGGVDSIYLNGGTTFAGRDLASPAAGRFVRVQCLVLGPSPRLFIPLDQIDQLRVRGLFHWGPWRTALTVLGGAIDIGTLAFGASKFPIFHPPSPEEVQWTTPRLYLSP